VSRNVLTVCAWNSAGKEILKRTFSIMLCRRVSLAGSVNYTSYILAAVFSLHLERLAFEEYVVESLI